MNFSLNGLVGYDLHGKTAGIIGTGRIGRIAAEIFHGFGMRVVAYDPFPQREWARLLIFPNVLVTAHREFLTREALSEIAGVAVANLQALAQGEPFVQGTVL